MPGRLTIGQLANAAGVPTSTVRFYERRGLIAPDGRSDANYRLYGPGTLERLGFIIAAKDVGFTLADIRVLLDFADGITAPCRDVQTLIEDRLGRTRARMERLQEVERHLSSWLRACRRAENSGRCEVVERLRRPKGPIQRKRSPMA